MEHAILKTIAYADIFDYPLTATEIHRYLVEKRASLDDVATILRECLAPAGKLSHCDGYFTLPGRETIVETRRRRAAISAEMWPRALHYGSMMGELPFVRMVAVTGALAVDNVDAGSDIDYMIVTKPGRLWLCRALIILVVHGAESKGDVICPNYFISENALTFHERSLYTAHEVVQMTPVCGSAIFFRMRRLNEWAFDYLPNARANPAEHPARRAQPVSRMWRTGAHVLEAGLRSPIGSALERWESGRKIRRMRGQMHGGSEAAFSADCCKGHFDSHGRETLLAFGSRLNTLDPND